jgi:hypothetical protein
MVKTKLKQQYRIEWQDAFTLETGWRHISTVQPELESNNWLISSMGTLVHKDKDFFILAMSYNKFNDACTEVLAIPRKMIKRIEHIESN